MNESMRCALQKRRPQIRARWEALLRLELNLFPEWYIAKHLGVTLSEKQQAKLEEVFKRILANNLAQPCVYVHRDYHSRNLMVAEPNGQARFPHPTPDGTTSHSTKPASGQVAGYLPQAGEGTNEKSTFERVSRATPAAGQTH